MNNAPHESSSFPELPTDRYRPERQIGRGAVGVVYEAYDTVLHNRVAIKTLQTALASSEDVQRFQREARALSSLNHQNILRVLDFGLTGSQNPYLVMDFIEGETLETYLEHSTLDEKEAVKIIRQLCNAMEHAHKKGVLHRDLKPNNVLMESATATGSRRIILFDFGLARINDQPVAVQGGLTRPGQILGSAEYMSPEQAKATEFTPQSDIYAMGCILFELLGGVPPFQDDSLLVVLQRHMNEPPPLAVLANRKPAVRDALVKVVAKALEKKPSDRFQSMAEFDDALAHAMGEEKTSFAETEIETDTDEELAGAGNNDERANLSSITQTINMKPTRRLRWATVGFAIAFVIAGGIIVWAALDQPKKKSISNALPTPKHSNFKLGDEIETARNLWGTGILEGRVLHLSAMKGVDKVIRERYMEGIEVETVVCDFSDITDNSMTFIGKWPVTNVVVSSTIISDKGMHSLEGNGTIKQLYVDRCNNIHGDGLSVIPSLPSLLSLMLGSKSLEDDDLAMLSKCERLRFLKINISPNLTKNALEHLKGIKNLEELTIGACPGLREPDVMQLRKWLPSCKIAVGPDEVKTIVQKGDVWASFVEKEPHN